MQKENEIVVEQLTQAISADDLDILDDLVAQDFVGHHPLFPAGIRGPQGLKSFFASIQRAMPLAHFPSWLLIAEGELVAVHTPLEGDFVNEFFGIAPSGKKVVLWMVNIWRVANVKIVEAWFNLDTLGLMAQLELIPFFDQQANLSKAEIAQLPHQRKSLAQIQAQERRLI
jgi:predicted ester cyclase